MPVRFAITKNSGQGETMVTDVCQWNPVTGEILHTVDEMLEIADEALKLVDMRTLQYHTRMLEAYSLEEYCTVEEWSRIVSILDIINGNQTADLVQRRWQSAREETEELELARIEARIEGRNGDIA